VDTAARTVTVFRPEGSANPLTAQDALVDEDVLPGCSLPFEELFGE
jgi:hypothetical protein